jgi:hypothetical protein
VTGRHGLGCSITSVVEDPSDTVIFRQIEGQFTVPNFLVVAADGSTRLTRDASGRPLLQGTRSAPFTAIVPRSAVGREGGAPLWIYGHGLFSDRTEITRDFGRATTSQAGAVAVATDYIGLGGSDLGNVILAMQDLTQFPAIIDKLEQGIVDTLVLPRTFSGACAALPALSADGQPLLDPSDVSYYGISMGGTLGSTVAALSPDIQRFALGAAGIDFPVMMGRNTRWPQLQFFFAIGYGRRIDRDLLMVMEANEWDRAEASAFAPHVLANPLPGGSAKQVLFQIGLQDADTTNVASEIAGRTLGLQELAPTSHAVWGLPATAAPVDNAYVVYDLGAAPLPDGTYPAPPENGVHEGVRRTARAQAQLAAFLRAGGQVIDSCGGACR